MVSVRHYVSGPYETASEVNAPPLMSMSRLPRPINDSCLGRRIASPNLLRVERRCLTIPATERGPDPQRRRRWFGWWHAVSKWQNRSAAYSIRERLH